jgi:hypothetical protein
MFLLGDSIRPESKVPFPGPESGESGRPEEEVEKAFDKKMGDLFPEDYEAPNPNPGGSEEPEENSLEGLFSDRENDKEGSEEPEE